MKRGVDLEGVGNPACDALGRDRPNGLRRAKAGQSERGQHGGGGSKGELVPARSFWRR
jgi:hypothetical protein